MTFGLRLLTTIAISLLLAALRRSSRMRPNWPLPPLRLPVIGLATWSLTALPGLTLLISNQVVLSTAGNLALLYGFLPLGGWLVLDIPGAEGWWRTPPKILNDLCVIIVGAVLTLLSLQQAGVSLSGLITTSAFLTAVVGFAAQEPLKDIFGGLGLQVDQPFKEGDWIQIGDNCGQVIGLTLMNTYIRNGLDGCTVIIPNDTVTQTAVRKIKPKTPYGNCFEVGLDYGFPPSQAIKLLLKVAYYHSAVLSHPTPKAWVAKFSDSSITYGIQVWHQDRGDIQRLQIRGELLEQIWYALERSGQSIPFPVRQSSPNPKHLEHEDPLYADDAQKARWIAGSSLFGSLKQEQIAALSASTRCIRFAKGETMISQGEKGDCCFQIITGMAEVFHNDQKGKEHIISQLSHGQIFGEMAICTNQDRNASVRAMEEMVLLQVDRSDLQTLIDEDQTLLEKLAHLVHQRQQKTGSLNQQSGQSDQVSENRLVRSMHKLYNVFRGS